MLDRDFNAAWIVLKRGLAQVGQDMPELKPVEAVPLPVPTTGRASPVGKAGTICDGIMPCLGPSLCEPEEPRE